MTDCETVIVTDDLALPEAGHSLLAPRRAVVFVEGASDQVALETLAARRGRRLHAEGVSIVPIGGATTIARLAPVCFNSRR